MIIENIDLGTIQINKKHSFPALVRNDTDSVITINKLKVSCSSCTEAKIRKNQLQPKEDVLIDVTFKPTTLGVHDKFIAIYYTENNIEMEYKFVFKALVK